MNIFGNTVKYKYIYTHTYTLLCIYTYIYLYSLYIYMEHIYIVYTFMHDWMMEIHSEKNASVGDFAIVQTS